MPVTYLPPNSKSQLRRPYYPGIKSSYLELIEEASDEEDLIELRRYAAMADTEPSPPEHDHDLDNMQRAKRLSTGSARDAGDYLSATNTSSSSSSGALTPGTPGLSRTTSTTDFNSFGQSDFPPVDRLTIFDILENLALPQRLERMQLAVHIQAEKVRKQRERLKTRALSSRDVVVDAWRKGGGGGGPEEQLERYRRRMRESVEKMGKRWGDAKSVTMKEKISFVTAVLNIFISGYLIGAWPEYFHYWYTAQLACVLPPSLLLSSLEMFADV